MVDTNQGPLDGVVAYVSVSNTGGLNASTAFAKKLADQGAKVLPRISREVTHIIFKGGDDELRSIYDRASKIAAVPATILGVGWVQSTEETGRRAMERPHVLARPTDSLPFLSPPGTGKKKRRRSMVPKAVDDYDLETDLMEFSSSQQMKTLTSAGPTDKASANVESSGGKRRRSRNSGGSAAKEAVSKASRAGVAGAQASLTPNPRSEPAPKRRRLSATPAAAAVGTPAQGTPSTRSRQPFTALASFAPATNTPPLFKPAADTPPKKHTARTPKSQTPAKRKAGGAATPHRLAREAQSTPRAAPRGASPLPSPLPATTPRGATPGTGNKTRSRTARASSTVLDAANTETGRPGQPLVAETADGAHCGGGGPPSSLTASASAQPVDHSDFRSAFGVAPSTAPSSDVDAMWSRINSAAARPEDPNPSGAAGPGPQAGPAPARCSSPPPVFSLSPASHQPPPASSAAGPRFIPAGPSDAPPAVATASVSSAPGAGAATAALAPSHLAGTPVVGTSSVEPPMQDLVAGALKTLRYRRLAPPDGGDTARWAGAGAGAMQACPAGAEGQRLTHLVVGERRRTMKVLQGIARGAWLLTPAWATESLTAGAWLCEEPYESPHFPGARRSRAAHAEADFKPLMHGLTLWLEPASALRPLALLLGAQLARSPRDCDMCLVKTAPRGNLPPGALCVDEEWLLRSLVNYNIEDTSRWTKQTPGQVAKPVQEGAGSGKVPTSVQA